jgi:hypothetical protein
MAGFHFYRKVENLKQTTFNSNTLLWQRHAGLKGCCCCWLLLLVVIKVVVVASVVVVVVVVRKCVLINYINYSRFSVIIILQINML